MTDWALIRKLMNAAIDTCENIENLGVNESHRSVVVKDTVTINDYLISAWAAPENLTRQVICKSHELGQSKPYTDELARTMSSIGSLCSELVKLENIDQKSDSQNPLSIKDDIEQLCNWYETYCVPELQKAMNAAGDESSP